MLNPNTDSDNKRIERRIERTNTAISEQLTKLESSFPMLSPEEEGFIRARASYLTREQKVLFASVLKKKPEVEDAQQ